MVASLAENEKSAAIDDAGRLTTNERKWARFGVLGAVVVFWLLATCLQPWHLFAEGPYTSDFYDVQARSIVHGHLDVPADVAGLEGFEVDGKTQLYFGIGPALLRLPLSGVSSVFDRRLSLLSELVALSVLGLAAARLLKRAKSLVVKAPNGSDWWYALFAAAASLGTPVLYFASSPRVYHEAEFWGAAAALAGLDLIIRWWRAPTRRHFLEAVALATFAAACRPSSGMSPAIALGLFGLILAWRRRWTQALLVLIGSAVPLLAFGIVNWMRFGSMFTVPFPLQVYSQFNVARQEMLRDNNNSFFGVKFVPTNLVRYFSPSAVSFQRLFPFVGWPAKPKVFGNVTFDTLAPTGSLLTGAPMLIPFAAVGAWWTVVRDRTREWTVIAIAALVSTFSTVTMAYIGHRFLADFVPLLLVLSSVGVWCVARSMRDRSKRLKRLVAIAFGLLFLFGFWNQLGLAISARAFSNLRTEADPTAMIDFQYSIDEFLFGGDPPNVVRVPAGPLPTGAEASKGSIVIVGNCGAMYRSNGENWEVLERALGHGNGFQMTGTIGSDWTPIVTAEDWTVSAKRLPDGVVFTRSDYDGIVSDPVALPEGDVTLSVTVDPNPIGVVSVEYNGKQVFYSYAGDALNVKPGATWTSVPTSAPVCESLLNRFGK